MEHGTSANSGTNHPVENSTIIEAAVENRNSTVFFNDGVTRIDMVLAYKMEVTDDEKIDLFSKTEMRKHFQDRLKKQGINIEVENAENSRDKETCFVKLNVPWNIMKRYAEIMNIKKPISTDINLTDDSTKFKFPAWCKLPNIFNYDEELIPPEPNYFSAGFIDDKEDKFIIRNRETFFSPAQRSMVMWQVLLRTKYGDENKALPQLLNVGAYKAAYPLHDSNYKLEETTDIIPLSTRQILYKEWATPWKWFKKQPSWLIKEYFGEKIGLYFQWLGFYTIMLIPPSIVGLLVFFYGLFTYQSEANVISQELCQNKTIGDKLMCPQCEIYCGYWKLKESCVLSKITYIFDNNATVFFAIFMSLWATMFLEFWKRKQTVIAWEWDLSNFEEVERPRPEFEAAVKQTRVNPVTNEREPYIPSWQKALRRLFANTTVLFMLVMVAATIFGIMLYRLIVFAVFSSTAFGLTSTMASLAASTTAAAINLACCIILKFAYERIALWLTEMEMHTTQSEFEDSYTFKVFFFQCINFYSSLVYIALFKGKFFSHPGEVDSQGALISRFRGELCDPAGCFYELVIQLAIIMVGKQTINNIQEIIIPMVIIKVKKHLYIKGFNFKFWKKENHITDDLDLHELKCEGDCARWEADFQLLPSDRLALTEEYLEMVIQYGFITLFIAAFPLAPLFALCNNIIEIRIDAYKFLATKRRSLAQRIEDIGAWYGILNGLTYISVITNALTIALASDFIPRLVYIYAYSADSSLKGYVDFSLSAFSTSDWGDPNAEGWIGPLQNKTSPVTECFFKAQRNGGPNYPLNQAWFHVFAAKLAFVLVFEHVIFGLTQLISIMIPDVPSEVSIQIKREKLLAREILFSQEIPSMKGSRKSALYPVFQDKSNSNERYSSAPSADSIILYDSSEEPPSKVKPNRNQ